jgi:hypothetical protein
MRIIIAFLLLTMFFAPNASAGTAVASTESARGAFELTVVTSVDPATPNRVTCTAVLKDTKSGEVLAAPRIEFNAGEPAEVSSTTDRSKFLLRLTSDVAANRVTAEAEFALDGEVVFAPRIEIELRSIGA